MNTHLKGTYQNFDREKREFLDKTDLSKKGSIDTPIVDLINLINSSDNYYTTSSCSGRAIIVTQVETLSNYDGNEETVPTEQDANREDANLGDANREDAKHSVSYSKQGCKWLLSTHDRLSFDSVISCFDAPAKGRQNRDANSESNGDAMQKIGANETAILKFEPFILHVCCKDLNSARELVETGIASGFRNSGMTLSRKGRIIAAIRCVPSYQVPIYSQGALLVSDAFIAFLIKKCNQFFDDNEMRRKKFHSNIVKKFETLQFSQFNPE